MKQWRISNQWSGEDYGVFEGDTAAHALAAMHRDAGYQCEVNERGGLKFRDFEQRELCGGFETWIVEKEDIC